MSLFIIFESLIKLTIKFTDRTRECERFGHEVFFPKLMCLVTYKEVFFFFFLRSASWICGNQVKYININFIAYFGLVLF